MRIPFLLRWTLANMLGWGVGMLLGALLWSLLGGFIGFLLAGALAGLCVGLAQWPFLSQRRWLWLSALGGGLAILPTFLAAVALLGGPLIGFFVVGAVYGGVFAAVQWVTLRKSDTMGLWILANVAAGGICGCLTMNVNPLGLPLFCSIGPVAFGLITGRALVYLREHPEHV